MSLKLRTLILLALVAVLLLGGALWLDRAGKHADALAGGPLLPGLQERLNALDTVRLVGAGDRTLVTLARDEAGWSVAERDGWPADLAQLRQSLLKLAQAQGREPKTAKPENYPKLGVEAVEAADARGVRIELEGGGEPLALIVGQNNPQGRGSFVRRPDEAQSWLADSDLAMARDPARWLLRELVDVSPQRIVAVEIRPAGGAPVHIERRPGAEPALVLRELPRGRQPGGDFLFESAVGLFDNLQLEDVRRAPAEASPPALTATYRSEDGLVIVLAGWLEGERLWIALSPSLDQARAQAFAEAESGRDRRAVEAAEDTESEELAPLRKDVPTRVAERRAEVEAIAARVAGWRFALPSFKAGALRRSRDDYLAPAD